MLGFCDFLFFLLLTQRKWFVVALYVSSLTTPRSLEPGQSGVYGMMNYFKPNVSQ